MTPNRRDPFPVLARTVGRAMPLGLALFIAAGATPVRAQRWWGNGQVSASETRADLGDVPKSGHVSTNLFLNVEDVLFYKNTLRLAGRWDWMKELHSGYQISHPVYYLDLSGNGYALNNSYSQYKRNVVLLQTGLGTNVSDVRYRDWRTTLAIVVPRYPWLTLMYNREHSFNNGSVRVYDLTQRGFVGEAGYARERYSLQGNYTEVHRYDEVRKVTRDDIWALSGTLSATTPSWRKGYASASYNYYDTERDGTDSLGARSSSHTVSGMASTSPWRPLNFSLSYSGRFTNTQQAQAEVDSRSQIASAGATWTPASYFSAGVIEMYQVETAGSDDVLQYLALTAALSKSLRRGVDTRLSMSRTIYQQANRVFEVRDSTGTVVESRRIEPYTIDTYYGGFGLWPLPYVDLTINTSLTRDPESPQPGLHYQFVGSFDGRFIMAANLEGRVSYSAASTGEKLHQLRASTETVNSGLSWLPRRNLNLSASYIVSSYAGGVGRSIHQLGLYLNYSFRRAFTLFAAFNEQAQDLIVAPVTPGAVTVRTARPRTTNIQLMIYTGNRSTLTVGYLEGSSNALSGIPGLQSRTWSGTFNFQI
jgi:hypothetical protein